MTVDAHLIDSFSSVTKKASDGIRLMARVDLDALMPQLTSESAAWIWHAYLCDSPASAMASLERALSIDPDNAVAQSGLGFLRGLAGQSIEANDEVAVFETEDGQQDELEFTEEDTVLEDVSPSPLECQQTIEQATVVALNESLIENVEAPVEADEPATEPVRIIPVEPEADAEPVCVDEPIADPIEDPIASVEPVTVDETPVAEPKLDDTSITDEVRATDKVEAVEEIEIVEVLATIDGTLEPVEDAAVLDVELCIDREPEAVVEDIKSTGDADAETLLLDQVQEISEVVQVAPTAAVEIVEVDEPAETEPVAEAETKVEAEPEPEAEPVAEAEVDTDPEPIIEAETTPAADLELNTETSVAKDEVVEEAACEASTEPQPIREHSVTPEANAVPKASAKQLSAASHRVVEEPAPEASTPSAPTSLPPATPEDPITKAPAETPRLILIVDDSPTVRKLVSLTLIRSGYEVATAADGVEALKILGQRRPCLILSDIGMPRLGGYQLCKMIKKHERTRDIPVVLLSGKDGVFDKLRGQMVGCCDYVTKPFESHKLVEKVSKHALKESATVAV